MCGLTQAVAMELGKYNIKLIAIEGEDVDEFKVLIVYIEYFYKKENNQVNVTFVNVDIDSFTSLELITQKVINISVLDPIGTKEQIDMFIANVSTAIPLNRIDKSPFVQIFKQQITNLTLLINEPERTQSMVDFGITVFAPIFSIFTNLVELNFGPPNDRRYHARLKIADLSSTICYSSSIVHLRISVDTFDDCLYLLDGRLNHLRQLVIPSM
ncbi:hypothetical protein I4U23_010967 [Adineta vaga]|nr:hypothetical protein I4U23_010967 [Adineta vaga]